MTTWQCLKMKQEYAAANNLLGAPKVQQPQASRYFPRRPSNEHGVHAQLEKLVPPEEGQAQATAVRPLKKSRQHIGAGTRVGIDDVTFSFRMRIWVSRRYLEISGALPVL